MIRTRGFTLLEVLVALAVVALALVALVRSVGLGAAALAHEREVTYAHWVAANVLVRTRLSERFPALGKRDGTERLADREWRWELVVQATDAPGLRRLDVRVFGTDREASLAALSGFAGQR